MELNELLTEITPYLMIILTAVASWLATKIKAFIDSKIDKEDQERLVAFIESTVKYVEQIGVDIESAEKLELAKSKVIIWANQKGITVSDEELEVLIEAFVNSLKGSE